MKRGGLARLYAIGKGEGLRAQLLRGGLGVGVLKAFSLPLTLLVTMVLARSLGPEGYGKYAFAVALITTLSIPVAPALMQLITRETAAMHQAGYHDQIRALILWANHNVLLGSSLIILVIGGVALWLSGWRADDRWTLLLAGLIALPLLGLNAVRAGVLEGMRRVVKGQFPDLFVRPVVLLMVVAVLLMTGTLTPLTAIFAFVFGAAMAFGVGKLLLKRIFPEQKQLRQEENSAQNREWLRAWLPFTLLVAASTLNAQIGILLLGWLGTDEQVAAMQVAERGAMLVALSLMVANVAIGPHITQVYNSGDHSRLQALSRHSAVVALIVALPIALSLIFFGSPILSTVLGEEYADIATEPLAILAIAQLINVAFGSVGLLLTMSGFERDTLFGQTLALIVNVFFAVILIPHFGAAGAAVATGIGLVFWNVILAVLVTRRLKIFPGPV